jgi:hypothetical protein
MDYLFLNQLPLQSMWPSSKNLEIQSLSLKEMGTGCIFNTNVIPKKVGLPSSVGRRAQSVKEEGYGENYCYLSQPAVWEY